MKKGHKLLHYKTLRAFNDKFYDGVFTLEHLDPEEKHFNKWTHLTTGEKEKGVNFAGYVFTKEAKNYLVQSFDPSKMPNEGQRINIKDILPIKIDKDSAHPKAVKNTVYEVATSITPVRHEPAKKMSYKELVDSLAAFHHSNKKQYKLWWMVVLGAYFRRCYARISTAPGFGKDSAIKILELLKGRANSINAEVSRAKLEFLTNQKVLGITELANLTPDQFGDIERFLLDVGDDRPTIPKRSRGYQGVGEILDVTDFSVLLLYNDLYCYSEKDGYFDNRAQEAVDDRFPPLCFNGTIDDKRLVGLEDEDLSQLAEDNMGTYRKLLQSMEYWEQNFEDEQNRDWTASFDYSSGRWRKNMKRMAKSINLYAESKEEYDEYVNLLKARVDEYDLMLQYPSIYDATVDGLPSQAINNLDKKLEGVHHYDSKIRILRGVQKNGIKGGGSKMKGLENF